MIIFFYRFIRKGIQALFCPFANSSVREDPKPTPNFNQKNPVLASKYNSSDHKYPVKMQNWVMNVQKIHSKIGILSF